MKVAGSHYRSIVNRAGRVFVIDQTRLPHELVLVELRSLDDAAAAIRNLVVRGAPLIGVTAAYGVALAMAADPSSAALEAAISTLVATRPTARNLRWAVDPLGGELRHLPPEDRSAAAIRAADRLATEDVAINEAIGKHGATVMREIWDQHGRPAQFEIATHCNAGWLACVDWGTALAAVYTAHDSGIPVHVWVHETRPVNQGSRLTTWELGAHGVPHTLQVDSASGSLMRSGRVRLCIVGADRVTREGDVCNKIGTYPLALAARDNGVPFYVALPSSTFDTSIATRDIEIESRSPEEVTQVWGRTNDGQSVNVRVAPPGTRVANPAFDITPARLVTGFITERGVHPPEHLAAALNRPGATTGSTH